MYHTLFATCKNGTSVELTIEAKAESIFTIRAKYKDEYAGALDLHKRSEDIFEIADLYIIPQFHRLQIGSILLITACNIAREKGASKVFAYLSPVDFLVRERLYAFYQSVGFEITKPLLANTGGYAEKFLNNCF